MGSIEHNLGTILGALSVRTRQAHLLGHRPSRVSETVSDQGIMIIKH